MAALAVGHGPFRRTLVVETGPLRGTVRPVNREAVEAFERAWAALGGSTGGTVPQAKRDSLAWSVVKLLAVLQAHGN